MREQSCGMPRRRVAKPFRGATVALEPTTLDELCAAYLTRAAPGQAFSHVTAARLLTLPLPVRVARQRALDVAALAARRPPQVRGVVGHHFDRLPRIVTVRGLPVISPVDTWLHLANTLTVPELVVVGDHLVRKKRPLAKLPELEAAVAAHAGHRNVTKLREALALVRPLTGSPKETELRLLILAAGLPEPIVGYEVHHDGYWVGTPDLAFPGERVAVEYEGEVHRVDPDTFREDIDRRERFEDAGWRVIRVTADQLLRPAALMERIRYALATRAQPGTALA
jgi:hypothetical protein